MKEIGQRTEFLLEPHTDLTRSLVDDPQVITKGRGVYVFDEHGKKYIEGVAGLWCTTLGFSEERLIEAATRQLRTLPFYGSFNHRTHNVILELAEKLISISPIPMAKVFFANSGSEANDSAIKLAWYYNNVLGRPQKKKIIAHDKGYHGVTIGSGSLTGLAHIHNGFDLPLPMFLHVPSPHYYRDALEGESEEAFATRLVDNFEKVLVREGPDTVAAFVTEPVMGAGGLIIPPATYFEKLQDVLRRYDILLIVDEVITGFGRTGNMFGSESLGLKPDMFTVAKALSSAYMPISALFINERISKALITGSQQMGTFGHGFTYSGHPVCAAVALEVIKIYEERDIVGHVRRMSQTLKQCLWEFKHHPMVGDIRHFGLLGGIELMKDKRLKVPFEKTDGVGAYLIGRAQHHGVIIRAMGDTIVFAPPLVIEENEMLEMFASFSLALEDTYRMVQAKWQNLNDANRVEKKQHVC